MRYKKTPLLMTCLFYLRILMCLSISSLIAAEKPQVIIQKMEKKFNSPKPIRISFQEVYRWTLTNEEISLDGTLILKGNDQFRMITDDQVMVSNGEKIWTYNTMANRVLIDKVSETQELLLPKTILLHYTDNYQASSLGEETINEKTYALIKLTSLEEIQMVPEILIWIDQKTYIPYKIQQKDANDNLRIFTIQKFEMDESIRDDVFKFEIPEGAEVIKMY